MNIWLVIVGEPLPIDEDRARLYRKGQLAEQLVARGHNVTLWSSTTNHMLKTKRADKTTHIDLEEGYKLVLLDAPMYRKNISFKRIWHNFVTARAFSKTAKKMPLPDVIVSSYPPIELCDAVTQFGVKHDVPTILDARDLWPDIFVTPLPKKMRWLGKILLWPFERSASRAAQNATAVTGISQKFAEWLRDKGGPKSKDKPLKPFNLAYSAAEPSEDEKKAADAFWDNLGVKSADEKFVACMIGNIGYGGEIDILIKAAKNIPEQFKKDYQFVICGTGMAFDEFSALAKGEPHIFMPGWMSKSQVWTLLRRSTVGTLPYLSDYAGLNMSFPNKVGEYLSAGLPIISSLHGSLSALLEDRQCGITYPNLGVRELSELFAELKKQPERIEKMSENARKTYLDLFEADKVYSEYCEFIEQIATRNKKLEI